MMPCDHQYGWTTRIFPLLSEPRGKGVLWKDAETAYLTYSARFGTDQSLERLAERGGFGVEEFVYLFHGLCPRIGGAWPVETCGECKGTGEVVQSDEGGMTFKCGVCYGAGAVLPKGAKA